MVPDLSAPRGARDDAPPAGGGAEPAGFADAPVPVYALVGWPLRHSLSPVLHGAAFAASGLAGRYELRPTPPAELPAALEALRSGCLAGANVTTPHKVAVRDLIDAESAVVAAIGAVNTIERADGGLHGDNTDVAGFEHALRVAGLEDGAGRCAVVLGSGGAARAVAYGLARAGYRVVVLARSVAHASIAVGTVHRAAPDAALSSGPLVPRRLPDACRAADLLVQGTTVGSEPGAAHCLWPTNVPVPPALSVIDVVAWPAETTLVRHARASGAPAMGGLAMLLGQAAASWHAWTGLEPPIEAMRAALVATAGVEIGMR